MLVDFLKAVLPESGFYCLVLLPEGRHIWTDSIETLAQRADQFADRTGVYFGTAAFKSSDNRKAVNVLALKALRLDIDAGAKKHEKDPDGTYPSQREALAALTGFIRSTSLAPSHIVSSGEGLHAYYALDEALEPSRWIALAEGLRQACEQHELRVDPTVTCDAARILRPLGGLHSGERRVTLLRATGKVYSEADLIEKLGVLPARKYDTSINDDAMSTVEGPPSSALKIVQHCGALREVAEAGGDVQEPFWRAMLGLVKFTVEAEDQAHEWSKGYPGYSAKETSKKLAAWATGPTTCAEFDKHTSACGACKHRGNVKSPISLGRMTPEQIEQLPEEKKPVLVPVAAPSGKPWDGQIPEGFTVERKPEGYTLVMHTTVEKEDEVGDTVRVNIQIPITHEIFWFSHWADSDGDTNGGAMITIHKWDDMESRVKSYELPMALLAAKADLAKKLAEYGILITTDKRAQQAMDAYTRALHLRIKNLARRIRIGDRFGMRVLEDGQLVSAHGRYVIYGDGAIRQAILNNELRGVAAYFSLPVPKSMTGEWDASVWDSHIMPAAKRHAEFMRAHYAHPGMEKYQLAFMIALASPLMPFVTGSYGAGTQLPGNGVTVSLYEREGGKGKTTLMQAASLAYGRPEDLTRDQNSISSTDLARIAKLGIWGTMPATFDEMGRNTEQSAANLISAVANGTSREGATKNMGLNSGRRWSLVCMVATNKSQRDMVLVSEAESSAVQFRLLELDTNNMPDFSIEQRAKFAEDWASVQDCAGALGAVIQREACAIGTAAINKLVMDCVNRAAQLVQSDKEERFQYRALGAMLATQLILKKHGLDMFNARDLLECFQEANDAARHYVKENVVTSDPIELIEMYLASIRGETLITQTRGTGGQLSVPLNQVFPRDIKARLFKTDRIIVFAADPFDKWCIERRVRLKDVIDEAKKRDLFYPIYGSSMVNGKLLRVKQSFNLTSGIQADNQISTKCYAIDLKKLGLIRGREVEKAIEQAA